MSNKELELFKKNLHSYNQACRKLFLKQRSFSSYYSRDMDNFIKKAYEIVLNEYFEDFLPLSEHIPFCILASDAYANHTLCFNETISLIFVYKDIKAYHLKPIIKVFIEILNDVHLNIDSVILEFNGLYHASNKLKTSIIQTRFICGSRPFFKNIKAKFQTIMKENKNEFAKLLFDNFKEFDLPFIRQEFNIKKDFGGLNHLRALEALLSLFKNSPKNYALNFLDEKNLSQLRLAGDFLLSLKSAMNLQSAKDEDEFLLVHINELSELMYKKSKKHFKAKELLVQKALQSMHTIGFYTHFLVKQIQNQIHAITPQEYQFKSLFEFFQAWLDDEEGKISCDLYLVFFLKNLKCNKKDVEKSLALFGKIFYQRHSFSILKVLLDSGVLKQLCKPFWTVRFLSDEEGNYSFDEQVFLMLKEFEKYEDKLASLKKLHADQKMILKLIILLSAIENENDISLASIYRAYCSKFHLKNEILEFGLKIFKNNNALKDLVEKEDIYNPVIISALVSKLENLENLELLYTLTWLKAKALNFNTFYFRTLDKLLENAKQGFKDENVLEESARRVKKELTLKRSKAFLEQDAILQDKILHIKSNLFIIKNSFEDIIKISKLAKENDLKFWFSNETNLSLELIAPLNFNVSIVLSSLANLNLIFMNFFELFDNKIYLKFEYDNIISNEQKLKLCELLNSNLSHFDVKKIKKPIIKKDELKLDLNYSKMYAKLGLNAKDQQGLMAYLMNVFNELQLVLCEAKIQTIRQRTRNIFIFQKNENLEQKEQSLINLLISE
ncbi:nucleotidyltransferase [Campylobacter sp. VicNov18]|uniref:nucleotidyltransferase n=1 Tax=Campylobacter bilis TaxID=2691918 RepID=UPI00130D7144|nr:nucleotidyltransferase [Campylobacter bilis]MPV64107.1 nucleotidyltransferase [Campylobacter hepaticus]MBM0637610.1 nucleotidyltransferase [Campylobacter bilis]MCC8278336.1 nucleotidyltransferase [Campylobacter bilis]MCC8299839.1 nucleotidyltransferase [Campylobacter bilis]MCC8301245.1 nucleotidyltransferase [Campylobacter bilis]